MSADSNDYMLTTYDNPYSPFDQFELWFKTDCLLGHNTCQLLDQVANIDTIQSEEINENDINDAINYIITQYPMIYKKVSKNEKYETIPVEDKNKNIEE